MLDGWMGRFYLILNVLTIITINQLYKSKGYEGARMVPQTFSPTIRASTKPPDTTQIIGIFRESVDWLGEYSHASQ